MFYFQILFVFVDLDNNLIGDNLEGGKFDNLNSLQYLREQENINKNMGNLAESSNLLCPEHHKFLDN